MYYVINTTSGDIDDYQTLSQVSAHIEEQVNVYNDDVTDFTVIEGQEMEIETQIKVVIS